MRSRSLLRHVLPALLAALSAGCSSVPFWQETDWPRLRTLSLGKANADPPSVDTANVNKANVDKANTDQPNAGEPPAGQTQVGKPERGNWMSGLEALSPPAVAASVKETFVGPSPNEQEARKRFAAAEDAFRTAMAREQAVARRDAFEEAAALYAKAAKAGADSPVEEDALLMLGESYFFADRYSKAEKAFGELVHKYPNTRHIDRIDKRRFDIAQYWLHLQEEDARWPVTPNLTDHQQPVFDTFGHAIKLFDRIRFDDPTGNIADDATMAAAVANFEKGKFPAADTLLADLRENFPTSEHQFQAHFLGLKCKQMVYLGPDYDGSILDEAEKLIKTMARQFPDQAREHREFLENAYRDIRLKKAQREFAMAQYFDGRKEYGAARIYYEIVQRDYGDTNLALEAEGRLAQLGGLPDRPEQTLQWLADLFPKEEQPKPLIARDTPVTVTR